MHRFIVSCSVFILLLSPAGLAVENASESACRIGTGSADITGPVVGVQFWGFVRAGQTGAGLYLRQRARAFLIEDPLTGQRLALVVCDLGSITHELHREVVDRLQASLGDDYSLSNVLISATHTHAAPGGFWHAGVGTPFGSPLHGRYFDHIADGIVQSIRQAHETLQPGNILIAQGNVPDAGANRSRAAYMNNPAEERARYDGDTDTTMTLLRFETAGGPIGCLNWFAVHPTTMTYNNRLVSGDNKGCAAVLFERAHNVTYRQTGEFVAAFAQSNCGDVTGNLNLDNTGPGEDEFETTRIIGERQYIIAQELFELATDRLSGPVEVRQAFIDFSSVRISDEYTQGETQATAPAAYGYAFAAGSTEDGGGHPLFREGMTETAPLLEITLDQQFPDARPNDHLRQMHRPKAILLAPSAMPPEARLSPTLSMTVARLGPLLLAAGPAEFTTMAGRRIRDTLAAVTGLKAEHVVIAGYSNGYAGYVTTFEEYQTQQYEGGHTLFGPWTLAAYQQEYARLASALMESRPVDPGTVDSPDLRKAINSTDLGTDVDVPPPGSDFGELVTAPRPVVQRGETVSATFWTGNPQNHFPHPAPFAVVERKSGDRWVEAATDADWATRCRFEPARNVARPYRVTITWEVPDDVPGGLYRIIHAGQARRTGEQPAAGFNGISEPFRIVD